MMAEDQGPLPEVGLDPSSAHFALAQNLPLPKFRLLSFAPLLLLER